MYVFAEHVHNTYISHHVKLVYAKHVRVMYDSCTSWINTYIHINMLKHNMLSCDFYPHVRVWRLILKKSSPIA